MRWILLTAMLMLALSTAARAQSTSPQDCLAQHFEAVSARDFVRADRYFSTAFLRAFKGDVEKLNRYYLARLEQLERGYTILESVDLSTAEHEARRVTVEFGPLHPEAMILVTERMYYYLVREEAEGSSPLTDAEGRAWRIEIFDSISFDSLADARRRPYLYTEQAWEEDESRELKSRVGLFYIQSALENFAADNGRYPLRLFGEDNARDELIAADFFDKTYPPCGFADRPMRDVKLFERSSGDFSYFGVDSDNDGDSDGYWLLLHGKQPEGFYYEDKDTIFILSSLGGLSQRELAGRFAEYWEALGEDALVLDEENWSQHIEPAPPQLADVLPASEPTPTGVITAAREASDVPGSGSELIASLNELDERGVPSISGEDPAQALSVDEVIEATNMAAVEPAGQDNPAENSTEQSGEQSGGISPTVTVSKRPAALASSLPARADSVALWLLSVARRFAGKGAQQGDAVEVEPLTVHGFGFD